MKYEINFYCLDKDGRIKLTYSCHVLWLNVWTIFFYTHLKSIQNESMSMGHTRFSHTNLCIIINYLYDTRCFRFLFVFYRSLKISVDIIRNVVSLIETKIKNIYL